MYVSVCVCVRLCMSVSIRLCMCVCVCLYGMIKINMYVNHNHHDNRQQPRSGASRIRQQRQNIHNITQHADTEPIPLGSHININYNILAIQPHQCVAPHRLKHIHNKNEAFARSESLIVTTVVVKLMLNTHSHRSWGATMRYKGRATPTFWKIKS